MGPFLRDEATLRKKERKDCRSQRGWRKPREHGGLNQLSRLTWAHRLK